MPFKRPEAHGYALFEVVIGSDFLRRESSVYVGEFMPNHIEARIWNLWINHLVFP